MPSQDLSTSSTLMKAARSGTAKSRQATPPMASNTAALDAIFGASGASSGTAEPVESLQADDVQPQQIVVADGEGQASKAAAPGDIFSRFARFSGHGSGHGAANVGGTGAAARERPLEPAEPSVADAGTKPAEGAPAGSGKLMERLVSLTDNGDGALKKAMAGAKVLTPLVAAVAFAPGSASPAADRRAALTATLVATQTIAENVAGAYEGVTGKVVPQWIKTQLMAAVAEQIAKRIEKQRSPLTEDQIQAFSDDLSLISREQAGLLKEVVESACNDAYRPCKSKDDARSRLSVTMASCAWRMFDWVCHERLSIDPKGEHPSRFFSYGLDADRIVQDLLRSAVDQASAFIVNPEDPDLRVAHLQNSINRFTNLIGAEYVTRTRAIMNWIGEDGLTAQDAQARSRQACERFAIDTLPRILEHARSTFAYIENGAAQVADGFYETLLNEPINDHVEAR